MRVLIVDPYGEQLDYACRCMRDGHEVKMFIKDGEKEKWIGRGLVDRVTDYRPWMRWANLVVVADNLLYLRDMEMWRREGCKIVGATVEAAAWELDRETGMKVMKAAGIPVPPYRMFDDYDRAISYVKSKGTRFVSKPCGDADKALSYVSKDAADLVYMLERWKRSGKLKGAFILQEFIPGIEMAVGGWFGPGGFNAGWCENWECKKLFPGELGPATGEMGTVLRVVRRSKLADLVLKPLEAALAKVGYVGYVDVNCIIDAKGRPCPLEFTMRFGYPLWNIQQALHQGDHAQWLLDLAEGRDADNWLMDQIAVGVVMAIPDFPYSHMTRKEVVGVPLYGLESALVPSVHPCQMMLGESPVFANGKVIKQPTMQTAGDYVLVASGVSSKVSSSRRRALAVLKKLSMPASPFWRNDIGIRLKKEIPELQRMGFCQGMTF